MDFKVAVTESTQLLVNVEEKSMTLRVPLLSEPDVSSLVDALNLKVGGDIEIVLTATEIRSVS